MKTHPLPIELMKLPLIIHQITGIEEFLIYGGTPIDLLLNRETQVRDVDIAIQGKEESKIDKLRERLGLEGFEILEPRREYTIYLDERVILVYAQDNHMFLDICFMNNPKMVGQYDIESLYWRYPQLDYVDDYGALTAIESKTIKPIRGLDSENPLLLTSRFIYLCAKYDASILDNLEHRHTMDVLKDRLSRWDYSKTYQAYTSCISSLLKAVLHARDRGTFSEDLVASGILETTFPEMHAYLKVVNKEELDGIQTKRDLCTLIGKTLDDDAMKKFKNTIAYIKTRTWDVQDSNI
jgi:hypothetical protein